MAGGEISMCICLAGVAAIIAVYGDRFETNVAAGNGAVFLSRSPIVLHLQTDS